MNKSLALKNKLYLFFFLVFSLFLFIYLFYFLINGERGIISYFKIKNLNSEYKLSLHKLEYSHNFLSDRISRLQSNSLDLDFLDEKIRERTGYLRSDELMIKFD